MENPLVSVIIPTYNSEATIEACLKSIKKQTYKNIEVIIVDNFSTDRTVEIAKKHGARIIQASAERAKAKNIGLKLARGEYVLFIDSDMELTPRVIEECVKLAETNPRVGGIIIPERTVGNNYWAKVRDHERRFYQGTPIESPRFFRKKLALKAGGYDEEIIFYEEATLPIKIQRLGYHIHARIKSYILHHEENFTLKRWIQKKYYYGKTLKKYVSKYKELASIQTSSAQRILIFLRNKSFLSKPHLAIGVLILKTLEWLAIKLGQTTQNKHKTYTQHKK
jgi:glycosyltransferase involved in cell wall biosynthesis